MQIKPLATAISFALLCVAMPAFAQSPPPPPGERDATRLDEVQVTARRRTETAQKVPVAISAFGADELRNMQARNLEGVQGAVPNLNIVQGRGSASSVNVFIRGIGQPDALQTFDPGVGIYVDDIYFSRIQGALFNLFDVERVEVLRGPQGTLYGKNSTGGAIKLVTREPGQETAGDLELTVGNYGRVEGRFYGETPLSDRVSASLSALQTGSNGYVDNLYGGHFNDDDTQALRLKIVGEASEALKVTFSADYTRQRDALTLGKPEAPLTQVDLVTGPRVVLAPTAGEFDFNARSSFTNGEGQELDHWGTSLVLDWTLSDAWRLKSISGYRELQTDFFIDIDASALQIGDVFVGLDQSQFSQELQLQYDNGSNFQSIFGLFYLDEEVPSHQEAFADDFLTLFGNPLDFLRTIDDDLQTKSYAAFAHAAWEFVPTWTLSAGLRYTEEDKDYFRTTSTFSTALGALNGTFAFNASDSWNAWTPSVSLQKQFNEHLMAYGSANRGFKSGGFNGRANSPSDVSAFNPEYVWTYELGIKASSDDGRLLANVTAFHSDYKDFQARVSEIVNPDAPIPTFAFPVLNAAALDIDGIEFEGVALVGEGTRLSTQIGYQNAEYQTFNDPRVALNPALASLHDHVPFAPDWTARVAAEQTFDLAGGAAITLGGDASYRSTTWLSVDNREVLRQGGYTLFGAFATWDAPARDWQVRAGVRNLSDKVYKTDAQEFSSVGNIQTAFFGVPANYYLTVRYSF
jgi:iron complex outermembrane receptor protein